MLRFGLASRSVAPSSQLRAFSATVVALAPKTGKVVSWMPGRGYGFIEDHADKRHHFVHYSGLRVEAAGFRALHVGQEVEFDVVEPEGRPRAENVTAPGGAPLPSGERPTGDGGGSRSPRREGGGSGGRGNYNRNNQRSSEGDRPRRDYSSNRSDRGGNRNSGSNVEDF